MKNIKEACAVILFAVLFGLMIDAALPEDQPKATEQGLIENKDGSVTIPKDKVQLLVKQFNMMVQELNLRGAIIEKLMEELKKEKSKVCV